MSAAPLDDDSRLLLASVEDGEQFTEFYRRNCDDLAAWLYRQTLSGEVAAELVAESFAIALAKRHTFRPERGSGRGWLWGIAANEVRRWWRKGEVETRARRRLGMTIRVVDDEAVEHVESLVDLAGLVEAVKAGLPQLPPAERLAVQLRVVEDLSYPEVCDRLGCSPNAARTRVSRGLARLRSQLEQHRPWPG